MTRSAWALAMLCAISCICVGCQINPERFKQLSTVTVSIKQEVIIDNSVVNKPLLENQPEFAALYQGLKGLEKTAGLSKEEKVPITAALTLLEMGTLITPSSSDKFAVGKGDTRVLVALAKSDPVIDTDYTPFTALDLALTSSSGKKRPFKAIVVEQKVHQYFLPKTLALAFLAEFVETINEDENGKAETGEAYVDHIHMRMEFIAPLIIAQKPNKFPEILYQDIEYYGSAKGSVPNEPRYAIEYNALLGATPKSIQEKTVWSVLMQHVTSYSIEKMKKNLPDPERSGV